LTVARPFDSQEVVAGTRRKAAGILVLPLMSLAVPTFARRPDRAASRALAATVERNMGPACALPRSAMRQRALRRPRIRSPDWGYSSTASKLNKLPGFSK